MRARKIHRAGGVSAQRHARTTGQWSETENGPGRRCANTDADSWASPINHLLLKLAQIADPRLREEKGHVQVLTLLQNFDPSKLTNEQLARIRAGENILSVITSGALPAALPAGREVAEVDG